MFERATRILRPLCEEVDRVRFQAAATPSLRNTQFFSSYLSAGPGTLPATSAQPCTDAFLSEARRIPPATRVGSLFPVVYHFLLQDIGPGRTGDA